MTTVEVSFTPLPAHVRTARLIATAVARRSGLPESLLDEVRLAVGEACSRAVEAHQAHCPDDPVRVALTSQDGRFEIEVRNNGRPAPGMTAPGMTAPAQAVATAPAASAGAADLVPPGFSLAVIAGLADDVQISETTAGTSVRMSWPTAGSLAAGGTDVSEAPQADGEALPRRLPSDHKPIAAS